MTDILVRVYDWLLLSKRRCSPLEWRLMMSKRLTIVFLFLSWIFVGFLVTFEMVGYILITTVCVSATFAYHVVSLILQEEKEAQP